MEASPGLDFGARKIWICRPFALLAQLVEHFHGKEGVVGSSPTEGFIGTPCYGGVFSFSGLELAASAWLMGPVLGPVATIGVALCSASEASCRPI